ncbi:hypothetical protein BON22_4751 [Cyberlindnera fabianii]|uniref:Uncharacterized protein n=1 Tax=Cyberlindnera fabianii TaxID=36022 RepID=A0A1V2L360_CYBFA|nr:hypothetical protein BON22_4751 [Cyberlindnera fabianii]
MMITSISSLSLINIKAPRLERLRLDVDSISKLQDCHFPQLRLLSLGDVSSPAPIDEMTFPNMDQVDFNCFNNVRELDILSSNPRVWSRFPLFFKGDLNEIALPRCNLPNLTNLSISCGDEYRTPDSLVTQILGLDTSLYPQLRKLHLKDVFIEEDVDLNFLVNLEAIDLNNVFNIPLIMGEVPHLKSAFIDVTDIEIVKDDHDNVLFPSLECLLLGRSLSTMERQYLINISNANADVIQC